MPNILDIIIFCLVEILYNPLIIMIFVIGFLFFLLDGSL